MSDRFNDLMDTAESAFSDERYEDALAESESALKLAQQPHQRSRALDRMAHACYRLKEDKRAFVLLDQAIDAALPAADTDDAAAIALARAWYDKGGMMAQVVRNESAFEPLDLLIDRFADRASSDPARDHDELRYVVVLAMDLKASGLRKLERARDAIACYDDMIRRFSAVTDVAVEDVISSAMLYRAWLLGDLGRQDEEIGAYDALVTRYGETHLLEISHTILDALSGKLRCYREQEDYEKAVEVCDEIIRRYHFDPGDGIADRVARTMIRRGNLLNKLGRTAEELAAYDQVSEIYGRFKEPDVRIHVAKSLMFKAVSLSDADQVGAEMQCYEEVLRRYAEDPDDAVRAVAADALIHKGMSLGAIAEDAAEDTGVREISAEIACYDEVLARHGADESIHLKRAVAEALLHKADTLVDAGQVSEASSCLDRLIAAYAEIDDKELAETVKDARALKTEI